MEMVLFSLRVMGVSLLVGRFYFIILVWDLEINMLICCSYRKNQPHRGTWIGKEFTYTGTFYVDEDMKRIEDVNHSTRHVRMSSLNPSDFHGYGKLFLRAGNM